MGGPGSGVVGIHIAVDVVVPGQQGHYDAGECAISEGIQQRV
jgi:hypothetical protein